VNILFLTQLLPYPLDAGPKVRAYYVLQHLAQHNTVTLATFIRGSDSPDALAHMQSRVARLVTSPIRRSPGRDALAIGRSALSGEPVLITRDRVPEMTALLQRVTRETHFDAIHADQLWMAPYALAASRAHGGRGQPRLVLDQHNAVHLIPRRLADSAANPVMRFGWRREARQMARYEAAICRAFDKVVTVTEADREALSGLYPAGQQPPFTVIPICIDSQAVQPRPRPAAPDILFLGGMHWPPNADGARWFAEAILPAIRAREPQARFLAVGRQPPEMLLRPESASQIEAPGFVDDPEPYWARSQVFVVPLRAGGGMRVKILDAWAQGLPIVSTTIGAEGLQYRAGEDILIADTPEAFAEAVLSILQNADLARRLAAAGRATVEQRYDWRRVYPAWDDVYASR
jgi:glycosyltransferase involved in cell wall biosynthesis